MRVLVAEDDSAARLILNAVLTEWGYEAVLASDGVEALAALRTDDPPRMAVLDWAMPGLDGDQICRAVRAAAGRYTYLVLVTGKADKADVVRGLEAGADDYLTKPFEPLELRARLAAGRRVLAAQDELIAAREAMRELAARDSLTGAWNHRGITERLAEEASRAARAARPVGVILADLDHFKRINDTHGHPAGDAVLREAARRITESVRPYDSVGRVGGEEFLVVAAGCGPAEATVVAERIRRRVGDAPMTYDGKPISVTVSLGVGVVPPGGDVQATRAEADAALYRAKNAGRNRVEGGDPRRVGPEVPT